MTDKEKKKCKYMISILGEQILVDVGKVGDVIGIFSPGVTLHLFIGFLGNLF